MRPPSITERAKGGPQRGWAGREDDADSLAERHQLTERIVDLVRQTGGERRQVVAHPLRVGGAHRQQGRFEQGRQAADRPRIHQRLA
jgi:hypothetical protein